MLGTNLGRYEVIKTLVKGEMTDLLLGRASGKERFQRHVAIKMLRSEHAKDPGCLEAFVNEARLAAALHHHNIVQVLDIGEEAGMPYFAMEYVHGVDLRTLLSRHAKRNEQLPLQHVVAIVASASAALHHAHEQKGPDGQPLGIVHRDVTPANILVGYDGNVKVVDFGIAKAAIRRMQTARGVLKGRVPYMAPEQCAGKPIDRRSDVFALGIVLFELATVRRLFKGTTEFLTMSAIVNGEIPKPSQYRRDIPVELEAIMMKALAQDPSDRFQTAAEMSLALDKIASKVGVGASTTALANYMRLQFGDQKEPWLQDGDPEEVTDVDFDGGASGLAPPSAESVKNNAIPRAVEASRSSPIAVARNLAPTPAIIEGLDDAGDPKTVVDARRPDLDAVPTPRKGIPPRVAPLPSAERRAAAASPAPAAPAPAAKPLISPSRPALPRPAKPPPPMDKSFSVATLVDDMPPVALVPPTPDDDQVPTQRAARTEVANPPPPPLPLRVGDATEIVAPLDLPLERPVVRRAVLVREPVRRSRPVLWIGGLVAAVVIAAAVVVFWPGTDVTPSSSAAPAPRENETVASTEKTPEKTPEPAPAAPAANMNMTMRDYEKAREAAAAGDASVAEPEAVVEKKPEAVVEKKPEAVVEKKPEVVAEKKPDPDEKKPEPKAKTAPAVKRTSTKSVAKTTTKRPATTTTKKKTTAKKPKWNPDELFLGE